MAKKVSAEMKKRSFLERTKGLDLTPTDLFGEKYNTELLPSKYFMKLYGKVYNTYSFHAKIQTEDFLRQLTRRYGLTDDHYVYKHLDADDTELHKVDYSSSEFLVNLKENMLLFMGNENFKIWYTREVPWKEVQKVLDLVEAAREKINFNRKFFMVVSNQNSEYGFELQQFDIQENEIDIESNYNEDFPPVHELISDFLKTDSQHGLVLLHGKYGTGKTTYLRYLISTINRRVIFLPLELIDSISSPGFLPFIAQYKDSILILEDCEELLRPRDASSYKQGAMQNLLNLGDGLLADALNIKLICTFNAELKLIDKAILRKGRLVARYEFDELSLDRSRALAEKLGIKREIEGPMSLSDIYNISLEDFSYNKSTEIRRVGY